MTEDGAGEGFKQDEPYMRRQKVVKSTWVLAPFQWYEGGLYNNTLLPFSYGLFVLPKCILDISNIFC